eukprot:3076806-Rhodomonas_salina.2
MSSDQVGSLTSPNAISGTDTGSAARCRVSTKQLQEDKLTLQRGNSQTRNLSPRQLPSLLVGEVEVSSSDFHYAATRRREGTVESCGWL